MSADDLPRRRPNPDSLRADRRPIEPADHHARRLGVLGHVECRRGGAVPSREGVAAAWLALARVALIAVPLIDPASLKSIAAAAALHLPVVAA